MINSFSFLRPLFNYFGICNDVLTACYRSTVATSNVQGDQAAVKAGEEEQDVLSVLRGGLCKVSEVNISNWNTNNNDRTDVELQPIFIPF